MVRRSSADAAETRGRILAAARTRFTAHGYSGASARDIAADAGVTIGAIFHHFGSKSALFRALFELLIGEMNIDAMNAYRTAPANTDPLDAFLGSLRAALSFAEKPDFHRVVTIDGPVVLGGEEWRRIDSRMGLEAVAAGIALLQSKQLIAAQPVKPLAVLMMGAMNNAGFALARREPGVDIEALLSAFRKLLEGLAPRT
jgi:AcrR family transcriptional regulator